MTKQCSKCHRDLDDSKFYKEAGSVDGLQHYCIECVREYRGYTPIDKSTKSASYLGVHIAEQLFQQRYPQADRMPTGNWKYDFECPTGIKVDVKSSTMRRDPRLWYFTTCYNTEADYFFMVAFDNRTNLQVQHLWWIPTDLISDRAGLAIGAGKLSQSKWKQYELPIVRDNLGS